MRLLAYTSPARGHLYPAVPILNALAARGHSISVCALAGELAQLAPLGIQATAIDPRIESIPIVDWRERSPLRAAGSVLRTFAERSELEVPDLQRAIERHEPDVLVVDINAWGAATVAEACGRPWAMYSPYLLPLRSREAPPFGPGLRPLGGPLGAVRDALVAKAIDSVFQRSAASLLNPLRARHGLPALEGFDDLLSRPPLLLSLTAEGFEYPRGDWPANVRLVGPMNWAPPLPAPAWIAELPDPLVLVTCSTELQRDKRLIRIALQTLPAMGMSAIATAAAHDPDEFEQGPRSRVARFVPHDPVLRRAACVICHGGLGITQKALSAGVPVVVVPFGRDQMETARRVELAGAGVRLSPRGLTTERLAAAVHAAVERRAGAERVSRAFASAGGPAAAAESIEALWEPQGGDSAGDKLRSPSADSPTSPVATQE
jgi:MGT family glycosyltransferase